jgi:hypothetical protein
MYSYSRINNATNPCLVHLMLTAACCAAVVAAAQQWWWLPIGTACHNFQHAAPGCSPVNFKKCKIGEMGLADLGGMGKQGVPIEFAWCRSTGTGRVPVMEQSEHESASEPLVIQAQGRRFGPHNLNRMKHSMQYRILYRIRYGAESL